MTTHGGPAHLVRHEETGVITYDNPGSMVWAVDRILGDPAHAQRMGENGRGGGAPLPNWNEVSGRYLELMCDLSAATDLSQEVKHAGGGRSFVMEFESTAS